MTIPFEKLKARLLANPKVKGRVGRTRSGIRDCRRFAGLRP
jgi:hypothetical protein